MWEFIKIFGRLILLAVFIIPAFLFLMLALVTWWIALGKERTLELFKELGEVLQ